MRARRDFARRAIVAFCCWLWLAAPACAQQSVPTDIRIHAGPLSAALSELAQTQRLDLIFDERLLANRTTVAIRGRMTIDEALSRLLAGTGMSYRRSFDNVILIAAQRPSVTAPEDKAVAEILVVGRLTQNADIKRTENDIQPYRVVSQRDVAEAHRDNIDDVLRARESQNAQIISASQNPFGRSGSNQSEIDLRGLGSQQTLVLIDGRRMPSIPNSVQQLLQPDLNAVPLGAVERIETLSSTAGGIYGPGATGGVINVVLRRAYRGAELNLVGGIAERGDAKRLRIEGRLGFTPDGGRTDIMLFASRAISGPIHDGDRDFAERAALQALGNSPLAYLARYPAGQGINVFSTSGDLKLDPALGGTSLGSPVTWLPLGVGATTPGDLTRLSANAGHIATALPDDRSGAQGDLLTRPTLTSALVNVRHHFGAGIDGYVDGIYLRNASDTVGRVARGYVPLDANAPGNPFSQPIILTYPLPVSVPPSHTNITEFRITAGVIVPLFNDWRANLDYSYGETHLDFRSNTVVPTSDFYSAIGTGAAGPGGKPALDPLGDWHGFLQAIPQYLTTSSLGIRRYDRLSDGALRVSGSLIQLPGGRMTLTALAGSRYESVPGSNLEFGTGSGASLGIPAPKFALLDRYAYAEIRSPLLPMNSGLVPLRGLELQIATRFDSQTTRVPAAGTTFDQNTNDSFSLRRNAVLFTAGLRVFPEPWLMMRGSVATGQLPPGIDQIGYTRGTADFDIGVDDPKRGGRGIGTEGAVTLLAGGSPDLRAERARSISFGMVINPTGKGPRLAIDFTQINKWDEISSVYSSNQPYFIAHEAMYPTRVLRAPLTSADAAIGFTAGRVIEIDTRSFNSGRTVVRAIDAQFNWQLPVGASSTIAANAQLTWEPVLRRRKAPDLAAVNLVDYMDGPLEWRGNFGIGWQRDSLSIGLNGQYFGSYRVANSSFNVTANNSKVVAYQGSATIPAQLYLDLDVRWRFSVAGRAGPFRSGEVALGVMNLADHMPPIVADPDGVGYSTYGDPRGRRFELSISARY